MTVGIDHYTKLMLHLDTDYADSSDSEHTVTSAGTAQISALDGMFGAGCLLLDGDSDYLSVPDHDDFNFGVDDFTIDFLAKCNQSLSASNDNLTYFSLTTNNNNHLWFVMSTHTSNLATRGKISLIGYAVDDSVVINVYADSAITDLEWHHVALVRVSGVYHILVDGVNVTTGRVAQADPLNYTGAFNIGRDSSHGGGWFYTGWIDEFRISKGIARWTANFTPPTSAYTRRAAIVPTKYAIELRDKNGYLKERLEPYVTSFNWEWNRVGGCGRATFKVSGDYLRFSVEADDDVRVYLPGVGGSTATLAYRGYVDGNVPDLSAGDQMITLECNGYFGFLGRVIVEDDGDKKVYEGMEVSAIVADIIDNYVVTKTSITKGTIQESAVSPDYLEFKGKTKDVLQTLFDLLGDVEYGVNENLQFYWYNQSKEFSDRLDISENIVKISDRVDYKSILNKIYFEGGDVNGAAFRTTGESLRSQQKYGLSEEILSNGSITTKATADQYIKALLKQRSVPQRQLSVSVKKTATRWENTYPMGAIAVIDGDAFQDGLLYGITANNGSNVLLGKTINDGDGKKYGTTPRNQIDRIRYSVTPQDGYWDADIQFGNSLSVSRASATLKNIEKNLDTVRQRSL